MSAARWLCAGHWTRAAASSVTAVRVRPRRSLAVCGRGLAAIALLASLGACAVTTGVGVGYEGEDDYVGGFYEPYGYDYGGWGGGYRVGPRWGDGRGGDHGGDGRGGDHGPGPGRGPGGGRPYHAAPPSRGMPSIPHSPRGH